MVLCGMGLGASSYQPTHHMIRQQRSAMTRVFCVMYCMVFCVFGFVFPICDVLTKKSGVHRLYSEIFLTLVMGLSIMILLYFFIYIYHQGGKRSAEAGRDELELRGSPKGEQVPENGEQNTPGVTLRKVSEHKHDKHPSEPAVSGNGEQRGRPPSNGTRKIADNEPPSSTEIGPPLSMAEEGLNLYTRIGTVVFAFGALVLKILRTIEPFEDKINRECASNAFILTQVTFIIFLVMETAFIFLFHQVVINKHKPFVRLCLMHLIATNLSVWLSGCMTEIVEDVGELFAEVQKEEAKMEGKVDNTTVLCHHKNTVADIVAPYTFPCLIEFSLIAAAAAFRMYLNVGKIMDEEDAVEHGEGDEVASLHGGHENITWATLKSLWRGFDNIVWMVSGLVIFGFVVAGVVAYLAIREGDFHISNGSLPTYIFLCTDLVAMFASLLAVCAGFRYIRSLKFHMLEEDSFDDKLLVMAQFGVFTYTTMLAISSITNLASGFQDIMYLYLLRAFLNFIQSGVQTVFVLDCMRRCAGTDEHVRKKPGRAAISFIIMVNLAMWLVNTFEMEKAEVSGVRVVHFDRVSWSIVSHILVPLVIFYRYHTTVCLSDVWVKAYERQKDE